MISLFLPLSISLILVFSFTNGMKDGNNVMATAIASGSISRRNALIIVSIAEFLGPFVFGTSVAVTVARGIINVDILPHNLESIFLILSGILGAIIWNIITWALKMPTSSSFALVGGLIGPMLYIYGKNAIPWRIFYIKVIGALFLSPVLGIFIGFVFYRIVSRLLVNTPYKFNKYIKKIQIITLIFLGLNHGNNDSQKAMGIIGLLLFLSGKNNEIEMYLWIIFISVISLTLGISMGGTKIIKTVGYDIFKLKPIHSLSSHISAASILLFSNLFGAPVSTTQIISSSVIGVGSSFRKKGIRWAVIFSIVWSWILTIPLSSLISIGIYLIFRNIFL